MGIASRGPRQFAGFAFTATVLVAMALVIPATPVLAAQKWAVQVSHPAPPVALSDVSCPTSSACVAVGDTPDAAGAIVTSTDGGSTWTSRKVPSGFAYFEEVSCATAAFCVAVGSQNSDGALVTTTNGGVTWDAFKLPKDLHSSRLDGVGCVAVGTSSDCVTGGTSSSGQLFILTSTDQGTTWAIEHLGSVGPLPTGISCFSLTDCVIVGSGGALYSANGGESWAAGSIPAGLYISRVSCSSASDCMAVGQSGSGYETTGAIVSTTDGGSTWITGNPPSGFTQLYGVYCSSDTDCIVVGFDSSGQESATTADGGSTWSEETISASDAPQIFGGLSCGTTVSCVSVGSNAVQATIASTANSGGTWSEDLLPGSGLELDAISCYSASSCLATGYSANGAAVYSTSDAGAEWNPQTIPVTATSLNGIYCLSSGFCVTVGTDLADGMGAVFTSGDGGSTWTSQSVPSGVVSLNSVSCASSSDCVAVGASDSPIGGEDDFEGDIEVIGTTDGGSVWTREGPSDDSGALFGVSCSSIEDCIAVGTKSNLHTSGTTTEITVTTTNGGNSWVERNEGKGRLYGVACPSTSVCVAVGTSIRTSVNGGVTWSKIEPPDHLSTLASVSCASTSDCFAAGSGDYQGTVGDVVSTTDGGAEWQIIGLPKGVGPVNSVSCPAASKCKAASQNSAGGADILSY
jgi:hypothetical protein